MSAVSSPWGPGLAVAAVLSVAACAQGERAAGPPPAPGAQRVIVTTYVEWPSAGEVAGRVARLAGVPVRDVGQDGPRTFRMTLDCPDDATCRGAMQQLREARGFVQSLDRDTRQRVPARPERETSR